MNDQPLVQICLESGSGHAIDFVKPTWTYP